jgi:hypothetical protein
LVAVNVFVVCDLGARRVLCVYEVVVDEDYVFVYPLSRVEGLLKFHVNCFADLLFCGFVVEYESHELVESCS